MIDRYTKIVLTVIAVALSAIAVQAAVGSAQAQMGLSCGDTPQSPCYVEATSVLTAMKVYVTHLR